MTSHVQVVCWVSVDSNSLNPSEWGWKVVDKVLIPITTDLPPAPDDLLTVIRCKCKTTSMASLCSCRKNNLHCVPACLNFHSDSCLNVSKMLSADDDDDVNGNMAELETFTSTLMIVSMKKLSNVMTIDSLSPMYIS